MLITKLAFRRPTPEDVTWAAPLLMQAGRRGCEYSFTTLYMWREQYDAKIARVGDYLLLSAGSGSETSFLPPVGPSLTEGIALLRDHTDALGLSLRLHGVDEDMLVRLKALFGDVREQEWPEDFDYLYRTEDLADLPGKAYHSKKNHISAFSRKFDWVYEPIDDRNLPDVLAAAKAWCAERGTCRDRGLQTEQCAIRELLRDRQRFSVTGGLIRVDGTVAAFTFGSPISDRVFDVHVEKALSAYPGAYAVINREFASRLTAYAYLNRENDLGIEGLRRAKQSYHPAILLKKYTCEIR